MNISDAQKDMRRAYLGGSTGALVSGSVWLMAGILGIYTSQTVTVAAFMIGGMFIFPISVLLDKAFGRSGKHDPQNPLGALALESTVMMLLGIMIALVVWQVQPALFFPCMLMVIAGRYLVFQTIYGMRLYWIFGAVLAAAAYLIYSLALPFYAGALIGGVIELAFVLPLMLASRRHT